MAKEGWPATRKYKEGDLKNWEGMGGGKTLERNKDPLTRGGEYRH